MPSSPRRCTCKSAVMLNTACPTHGEVARALSIEAIDRGHAIMAQPPGRCELCGAVEETRPYGPNGEEVCFPCGPGGGLKARAAAEAAFARRIGFDEGKRADA